MKTAGQPRKAFTVATLEKLKPGPVRRELPDAILPGLYHIIQPSGARSWSVRYRADGASRKYTLGPYPKLNLTAARDLGRAALRDVAEGKDPAKAKQEARRLLQAGLTDRDLVGAVFTEYEKRHLPTLRESTSHEIKRLFNKRILPRWRKRQMQEIGKRDILALADTMISEGAPISANRMIAAVSHFFNWAVQRDIIQHSPCIGIKKPSPQKTRDRVLSDSELRWLWLAANDIKWPFGPLTKLLILTGARRAEVTEMPEAELNTKAQLWTIPGNRAKNGLAHEIHLTDLAVEILEDLPRIKSKAGYLFTTTGETPVSGLSRAKLALDAAMLKHAKEEAKKTGGDPAKVKIAPWVMHDLRRTMATGMAALGIQLPVVERCLNHVSGSFGGVAGIYQRHNFAKEKVLAFEAWSSHVAGLVAATAPKSNVTKLRPRRKLSAARPS